MKKRIYDNWNSPKLLKIVDANPVCGVDFCDECGDCLACYADNPCYPSGGKHTWVTYRPEEEEWVRLRGIEFRRTLEKKR